ncbi:MAG TPA: DNA/RNA nuclease SfsA [Oscillatoriales cyanobacterium M59_W2019_021]|nr:DNA/RNA nuclease SfsA [Oscillatoriales cyanobacterium M4454_W2019_049]HIK51314.1 DNA/RNA nuclease SfsA [Oscillatoriales cyanobacterium M59_W2019_021]
MNDFVYNYPLLVSGTLVKRYKRFLADVELVNGEIVTAHCPNTGPMIGVSDPCSPVLMSCSTDPKRKYPYTWETIQMRDARRTWVGINTALPNRIVKTMLEKRLLPELGNYSRIQPEVAYGRDRKSRVDFVLWGEEGEPPIYVEVKNTTWADNGLALFPDTVTTRGQRHLQELMAIVPQCRAVMLYFINRGDCDRFSPGDTADPAYGQLLREAVHRGVEVLPCRFEVTPEGIRYLGLAQLAY